MTSEFECRNRFWESQELKLWLWCFRGWWVLRWNLCRGWWGGVTDLELAKFVSKFTWVLWDVTVFPPQGSHPEILRYMGKMGGLWEADGGPCTVGRVWNKGWLQSHHSEWQSSEQSSEREVPGDINIARIARKNHLPLNYSFLPTLNFWLLSKLLPPMSWTLTE